MTAQGGQGHDAARVALGAYLLGGLGSGERAEVEEHLRGCPACRDELATLAVVPTLLRRIQAPAEPGAGAAPAAGDPQVGAAARQSADGAELPRLLARARSERARQRRQLARWRAASILAGVAAAGLAATLGPAALDRPAAPAGAVVDIAMTPRGVVASSGRAGLEGRTWGTAVSLELQGLPAGTSFVAWAVADDGRREQAAAWGPTPSGAARLSGATAIPRAQLARLEVTTSAGAPLLTAPA